MATALDYIDRAKGDNLTDIAKRGFGGWLLSIAAAAIAGVQSLLQLLLTPVDLLVKLMQRSVGAFFLEPLGIIESGAQASATGASEFGLFGLLVAVAIVLASFWMVIRYLQEDETTDVPMPGVAVDLIPFVGVDEEDDADD